MLEPKPHQIEAIQSNFDAFKVSKRIKNIMACGSGKTLVALKTYAAINQCEPLSRIVIFVPTIMLIHQFASNFIDEFGYDSHEIAVVCSKRKILIDDIDSEELTQELKLTVYHTEKEIRDFLKAKSIKTKVVFSTYASAKLLKHQTFDLGIFDEAHKTSGEINKPYSYPLYDENMQADKRLFLTATEKIELYKKDKRVGMNNTDVYGETSYSLSFRKAIELGLITDYKLIITAVSKSDVADLITNENQDIYQIANLFALEKVRAEYGVNKIITFHNTIQRAESFARVAKDNESNFKSLHINGTQSSVMRKNIFNDFRTAETSFITNARCLTEGIDVPDVDAVAFFDPKAGEIDIVQAIGRTVRLSKNKTHGYIILPLYLWDLEAALAQDQIGKDSAFRNIIDVMSVLQNEDESFKTRLTNSRLAKAEIELELPIEILGELPTSIDKNYLYENIYLEVISNYDQYFMQMLSKLSEYIEEHGLGYVPLDYKDRQFALWANNQRKNNRTHQLPQYRKDLLVEHGFIFSIFEYDWELMFNQYKDVRRQGIKDDDIQDKKLKKWIARQKEFFQNNRLGAERYQRLKAHGFEPKTKHEIWLGGYEQLIKDLESAKELSNITKKHTCYDWLRTQRRRWVLLDEEKKSLLLDLGWNKYIENLGRWKNKTLK